MNDLLGWRKEFPILSTTTAFPLPTLLGLAGLAVVCVSTLFIDGLRIMLPAGLPWLGLLTLAYWGWRAAQKRRNSLRSEE